MTNRREYGGKVWFLDHGNNLNSFDINTYEVQKMRLDFN